MRKTLLHCLLAALVLFGAVPWAPAGGGDVAVEMAVAAPTASDPMDAPSYATVPAVQVKNLYAMSFNDGAIYALDNMREVEVLKLVNAANPATAHPLLC